ncbi:hypothetical protein BGZ81_004432 [Podila clonocystis]|nr:hypothetical protein BGZ81_004432 [Podila clonocystis]
MTSPPPIAHPLHLPELLLATAEYLNKRDIVLCLYVCQAWNTILHPQLWQSLAVNSNETGPFTRLISKNARHIRNFVHVYSGPFYVSNYPLALTHLVNLEVMRLTGEWIVALVRSRSTLQSFRWFHSTEKFGFRQPSTEDDYPVYDAFWEAIAECHSLKKLDIPYIAKEKKYSSVFLTLCQKLSVLSLTNMDSQYLPTKDMLPSTGFPKMKQLSLKSKVRGTVSEALDFISHCPNLTHLELDPLEMYFDPAHFQFSVTPIVKPLMSQLQKLLIHGMPDDLTARLWKELPMARCLSATNFGPECTQFLVNPTNRVWACQIREIIIKGGGQIGSSKIVQALTICSGLRKFETSHIDVRDMISIPADYNPTNLRPWVCLDLEELRAEFSLPTSMPRFDIDPVAPDYHKFSSLVFTQIAALKRLRRLDLMPDFRHFLWEHFPLFTLGRGLELLTTLTELEYLNLGRNVHIGSTQDLDWMMKHLPSLQEVRGSLNPDSNRNYELHMHMKMPCPTVPGRWFKVDAPLTIFAPASTAFSFGSVAGSPLGAPLASTTPSFGGSTVSPFGTTSNIITSAFGASTVTPF